MCKCCGDEGLACPKCSTARPAGNTPIDWKKPIRYRWGINDYRKAAFIGINPINGYHVVAVEGATESSLHFYENSSDYIENAPEEVWINIYKSVSGNYHLGNACTGYMSEQEAKEAHVRQEKAFMDSMARQVIMSTRNSSLVKTIRIK